MENIIFLAKKDIHNLPTSAGVYLFFARRSFGEGGLGKSIPAYIGKAINIKERVKNHFLQPTYKDNFFIPVTEKIGYIETGSEIEALVLEASLIKKYQPKFNSVWRDDKNYFYVAITRGPRPIIFITHQPHKKIATRPARPDARIFRATEIPVSGRFARNDGGAIYIGPFVEGNTLKKTLKYLRKVFPFYTTTRHPDKKCTWCHLDLCPGPVRNSPPKGSSGAQIAGGVSNGAGPFLNLIEYQKNIKKLTLILQGKRKTVLYALKKEMAEFSRTKNFEEALTIREKIRALEQVMAHASVINSSQSQTIDGRRYFEVDDKWPKTQKLLQKILQIKTPIFKIECYDISNIQGMQAVGSMVVFVNGKPDKSQYKKFRINPPAGGGENTPNDIAMLGEVLSRRLLHPEWGFADIMLIDGGIAQLNIGIKAKNTSFKTKAIKVISIAKGKQELLIEGQKEHISLKKLPQEIYNLIVHLDDEAHRFAITYHKKLRKKNLLAHT